MSVGRGEAYKGPSGWSSQVAWGRERVASGAVLPSLTRIPHEPWLAALRIRVTFFAVDLCTLNG